MTLFTNTGVETSCGITSGTQYSITVGEGTGVCCGEGYEMMWWGVGGMVGDLIDGLKLQFQCTCSVFFFHHPIHTYVHQKTAATKSPSIAPTTPPSTTISPTDLVQCNPNILFWDELLSNKEYPIPFHEVDISFSSLSVTFKISLEYIGFSEASNGESDLLGTTYVIDFSSTGLRESIGPLLLRFSNPL